MKIGVVTPWWCYENYGQLLQAFAMQQFLRTLGHEPFVVKYKKQRGKTEQFLRLLIHPVHILKCVQKAVKKQKSSEHALLAASGRKFNDFRKNHLVFSAQYYPNLKSLAHAADDCGALLVGSDNVWCCPTYDDYSKPYFLAFGKKDVRRVAYSASFGAQKIDGEYQKFAAPLLKGLDAVGVREKQSIEICGKMGRMDAVHVLDPVLMAPMSAYENLCAEFRNIPSDYAFFYYLDAQMNVPWDELKAYTAKQGLSNYFVPVTERRNFPFPEFRDPTIPEWVARIRNAREVFTNSFHGTCFSILFHKPFLVFLRETSPLNSRLSSLLQTLGLTDRIYDPGKSVAEQMEKEIDWTAADARLRELQDSSVQFLKSAIS